MKNKLISPKLFFGALCLFLLSLGFSFNLASAPKKQNKRQNQRLLEKEARRYLGARYKYGSSNSKSKQFDCSGLVWTMVSKFLKKRDFPRTSQSIFNYLSDSPDLKLENAKRGDFVFFERRSGSQSKNINHVGLYWGKNKKNQHLMYHASSSNGVEFRNINSSYWGKKFVSIKRYQPFYKLFN